MLFTRGRAIESEEGIGVILDSLHHGLVIVRERKCELLFANATARKLFDLEEDDTQCQSLSDGHLPDLCKHCPNSGEGASSNQPASIKSKDGHWYTVEASPVVWVDQKPAVMLFFQNADQAHINEKKLYSLAYIDQLTLLPNRARLEEDVKKALGQGCAGICGCVALFDMDHFKQVNDTYGHNTGNVLLKRLAQHLQLNPTFKGRLYRLSGDEFALFLLEKKSRYSNEAELRKTCEEALQAAFYSYTMPNIDLECTISMGVSYFPSHGCNLSELLRKADIALYRAKTGGRNQMTVFEEWYDTARKFSDYYVNIRPILAGEGKTYGYELVDTSHMSKNADNSLNLNMQEFNRAIEALNLGDLDKEAHFFIQYTPTLSSKVVLDNLPTDKFIIQARRDCSQTELDAYRTLRTHGYRFMIDSIDAGNTSAELIALADYFRFAADVPPRTQEKLIKALPDKTFIAAGLNTVAAYKSAQNAGFQLFQGQYFNQPFIVKTGKDIDPLKTNYFRLLALTSTNKPVDFQQIADIISEDAALTYRLLTLLNSTAIGLRNRISSVKMSVSYLGEEIIKKWIALLALRGLVSDKPLEIVRISLIRARFGELLCAHINPAWDSQQVFLTGMLSLLHIALEKPKEELLKELSVADEIRTSLLTDTGIYSQLLAFFLHYEYSNWEEVTRFAGANNLTCELIYDHYIASVKWYNLLAGQNPA